MPCRAFDLQALQVLEKIRERTNEDKTNFDFQNSFFKLANYTRPPLFQCKLTQVRLHKFGTTLHDHVPMLI